MSLQQVSLPGNYGSLIGYVSMTSAGAPSSNVAESLDDADLGPFTYEYQTDVSIFLKIYKYKHVK